MKRVFFLFTIFFCQTVSAVVPSGNHDPFIIHVIPKCGVHFIKKTLKMMVSDPLKLSGINNKKLKESKGYLVWSFDPYSLEKECVLINNGYKIISMIRDPRDALISMVAHMRNFAGTGQQRDFFTVVANFDDLSFEDQITSLMVDTDYLQFYRDRINWSKSDYAYCVKYENLVGSKGGGDDATQLQTILKIAEHIHLSITLEEAERIASSIYNQMFEDSEVDGVVFHRSQIGSWKDFFTEKHKKIFKKKNGKLLISLGYEKNSNW